MNVAQKLVECLIAEGVEYVFGIPGEENLEVIEALASSPIRFITTRHEPDELCEILEDAFRQEVPVVIDCPVDYRENTLLTQRLKTIMDEHRT